MQKRTMRTVTGAAIVGLLAVSGWLVLRDGPRAVANEDAATGRGAASEAPRAAAPDVDGVQPRKTDPANRAGMEHTSDVAKLERYRDVAAKAHDHLEDLKNGATEWMDFVVAMTFADDKIEAQRKCGFTFLEGPCAYSIAMVVARTGADTGSVVYSHAEVSPGLTEGADVCRDYVGCLARERVGGKVPLPAGSADLVGYRRDQTDSYNAAAWNDPEQIERTLDILKGALEDMLENGPTGDPMWPYYLAMQKARVSQFERQLSEIR